MATNPTKSQARLFAQLLETLEPEILRAFMASVTDLQSGVNWPVLLTALAAYNIEGAIAALNISAAAWAEYSSAMTAAYARAGASTAAQIQATGVGGVGIRFNMTNARAQAWIAENVAGSVVGFTTEQVQVARGVIEAGYALGQGPRTIAIDLVGRANGGARQGGVLGLDGPRADRLQAVTQGMRTPEGVRSLVIVKEDGSYAMRYKVNPATAQRIISAYKAGTEVPEAQRLISERQYKNALLQQRAETVAVTETASAVNNARDETWQQLAESQGLNSSAVVKTWRHARGSKDGRETHISINGQSVRGLNTPFILSDGSVMQFPHDSAGGARNNINCACHAEFRLDQSVGLT